MKKIIISFIESIISFVAVLIYLNMFLNQDSYNILLSLLFFTLWYVYYKNNIIFKKKNSRNYILFLSMIVSLILSIGKIGLYIYSEPFDTFTKKNILYVIIMFIGFTILHIRVFNFVFSKVKNISIIEKHPKINFSLTLLIFSIIMIGYGLYFIRFYPAIMTPDSYYVINYANNFVLSDFHTFGHTWFFGIPFHIGKFIFKNYNLAVSFSILFQMICCSLIFTTSIRYLYNKGLKKSITILLVLLYAFNPLYAHYSITLWRDVLFGCAFVLLFISLYDFLTSKIIKKRTLVWFILSILIILFFRNNGIYVYIFCIPFIIFILKGNRKIVSITCLIILVFYIIVKGPIFNYFNVAKTKTVEAYSIPLQQISRVIALDKKINYVDEEFLRKLFDYEKVKLSYRNITSDPIKNITDGEFLRDNKLQFFKTYLHLLFKYPKVYVEAYMFETVGYWYPDIIYWATGGESRGLFESENVYNKPLTPKWYNKIIDYTTKRNLPLSNLIWSVGLSFIIMICSATLTLYYNRKFILCFIPLFGLWLSIMASTPVFCELRYVYGIFTCIPILIIFPLVISNLESKKEVKKYD